MKCQDCQKEISNEAKFCQYCGAKVNIDETIERPNEPVNKSFDYVQFQKEINMQKSRKAMEQARIFGVIGLIIGIVTLLLRLFQFTSTNINFYALFILIPFRIGSFVISIVGIVKYNISIKFGPKNNSVLALDIVALIITFINFIIGSNFYFYVNF